jgi:hypothetical protein
MIALRQWGEKYMFADGSDHSSVYDRRDHNSLEKMLVRSSDGRVLGVDDIEIIMPATY